jgi:hypothetical protein
MLLFQNRPPAALNRSSKPRTAHNMSHNDQEGGNGLKLPVNTIEQLRDMLAGRGDGIHLDTPFQWGIDGLEQPVPFFEHLPTLLPPDAILYLKGTSVPEVAAFYTPVARDTQVASA